MINLTLEETTYTVPSSWDEVTLATYTDILNAQLDKYPSNILKIIKCIVVLAGQPELEQKFLKLEYDSLQELLGAFSWLSEEPDYTKLPAMSEVKLGKYKYTIRQDFNKLSVNEMILIEELLGTDKFDLHYFEIAAGLLLRKLDNNGNELDASLDLLLETVIAIRTEGLLLKDFYPLMVFFSNGAKKSTSKTSSCSSLIIQKTSLPQKKKRQTGAKQ